MDARLPFPLRVPFAEALGLELWEGVDGEAQVRIDLARQHLNSGGVAHGGVLMSVLDVAMAYAARSADPVALAMDSRLVTLEMKTSFMRPATGSLRATGKLLHRSGTLAFCEATVVDGDGQLCAHATGTFKVLRTGAPTGPEAGPILNLNEEAP